MGYGLREPFIYCEINNIDVSTYISPHLISFTYTDNDGIKNKESDDIEIELEDKTGFFRENPPARGSFLKVSFGYISQVRDTGIFYIDSYTYKSSRSGDIFTIKAITKDVEKSFRTINTKGFEETTLKTIVSQIAAKNKYKLNFSGDDVEIKRATQYQKRDLEFLKDLCTLYGYMFKITNNTIVIKDIQERLSDNEIYVLDRDFVIEGSVEVSSLYAKTVDVIYYDKDAKDVVEKKDINNVKASGDTEKINVRVENKQQANKIASNNKLLNEMKEIQINITSIGIVNLAAGKNVELKGFGKFDNIYYTAQSVHRITRSGYTTDIALFKNPKVKK